MMILAPVLFLLVIWGFSNDFPRPFDDFKNTVLYMGGGVFVLWQLVKHPLTPTLSSTGGGLSRWERGTVFLYFTLCLLSIAFAPSGQYEGLLAVARLVIWGGLAWAFAQLGPKDWGRIAAVTVLSAALIGILTFAQSKGAEIWSYTPPILSPIGHVTYYGDFMALSLVMAVGLFAKGRGGIWVLCIFLISLGLWMAATRASVVGLVAGLMVGVALLHRLRRLSLKHCAIGAGCLILTGLALYFISPNSLRGQNLVARLTDVTSTSLEDFSSARLHTYRTSLRMSADRPLLGWGLGSFRFNYPEYAHQEGFDHLSHNSTWYMHPHNEVLNQAVELGLPGALLFLLGFAYLLYRGIQKCWTPSQARGDEHCRNDDAVFLITAICGLTVAFVSWQFSTNFLFPASRLITALFAGIIMSSVRNTLPPRGRMAEGQERGKRTIPGLPRRPTGLLAMTALATLFVGLYQVSLLYVQRQQRATSATVQQDATQMAIRLAPGAFDPMYIQATSRARGGPSPEAIQAVDAFYTQYPFVPLALYLKGMLSLQLGDLSSARDYLKHSLRNDPSLSMAKGLLQQIRP